MSRHRYARFLLILTALWLPLQAMASVTMSFCRHDVAAVQQPAPQIEAALGEEHCPYHDADAGSVPAPAAGAHDCDNCGICHLACAGYMPAAAVTPAVVPTPRVFQPLPAAARSSHIPEPPQYPPKRSA